MTTISSRGTIRTTSRLRAFYLARVRRGYRCSEWLRPRVDLLGQVSYERRWILIPVGR